MHRISNPRDVEEADGPPSAPSTVARSTREQDPLRASSNAWFVGVLVAGYGLLLVGTTSAEWLSLGGPGSHLGPPSIIQAFTLRIAEGVYLGIFGVVLAVVERSGILPAWVIAPSALPSYTGFNFGSGNLAPADGTYVLWVHLDLCETPATPPCSNYTVAAIGNLVIATQKAYVPIQLALGAAGSVLIAVPLIQSGIGSRRTTSR